MFLESNMKKVLTVLSILFVFSVGKVFSQSADIQIGVGIGIISGPYDNTYTSKISGHQFFGESKIWGVGESIDFSTKGVHLTIGPAFGFDCTEDVRLQFVSGLRFGIPFISNLSNVRDLQWGNDFQIKFGSNRLCVFVVGLTAAIGAAVGEEHFIERDSEGNIKTESYSKTSIFTYDISPYMSVCFNMGIKK